MHILNFRGNLLCLGSSKSPGLGNAPSRSIIIKKKKECLMVFSGMMKLSQEGELVSDGATLVDATVERCELQRKKGRRRAPHESCETLENG